LATLDDEGRVERVDESAVTVAEDIGIELRVGGVLSEADRAALADRLARVLFEVVDGDPSALARSLMGTEFPAEYDFDTITFSGGVSEYVYGREHAFYHDLGPELGVAIRDQLEARDTPFSMLDTGIRATAAGSNQYSMEVSGNTIMISDESLLPLRNVPMVPFTADADEPPASIREKVHRKLDLYDIDEVDGPFAYGFHLHGQPTYAFLDKVVEAAVEGLSITDPDHPAILMFDMDIGMSVGNLVKERTDRPVIAIDGIDLKQFGYVDVGEPLAHTDAVPVTVKSLVF
jgi:ethanolamine utilization protein EutA